MIKKLLTACVIFAISHQLHAFEPERNTGGSTKVLSKTKIRLMHQNSTYLLDCNERYAVKAKYRVQPKQPLNTNPMTMRFNEQRLPDSCKAKSVLMYIGPVGIKTSYNSGYLVNPAFTLENSDENLAANAMFNVLPMERTIATKHWNDIDKMVFCNSDGLQSIVIAGVGFDNSDNNDFFKDEWGIRTPDVFYKIAIREDGEVLSYLFPNDYRSGNELKTYSVSIKSIERALKISINDAPEHLKDKSNRFGWDVVKQCNIL